MSTTNSISYSVGVANYTLVRGDTFRLRASIKNQYGAEKNIGSSKVWFTVKNQYSNPDNLAVFKADSSDGSGNVVITNASRGLVDIRMPQTYTLTFPDTPVKLYFDIQILDDSGDIVTVERGELTVVPDVTRAV